MGPVRLGELPAQGQGRRVTKASQSKFGFIDKLFDFLCLVLAEPRTTQQLLEVTSYKPDTIYGYLRKGEEHGLIYIQRWVIVRGRERAVWAIQPKPFALPNAPPPSKGGA